MRSWHTRLVATGLLLILAGFAFALLFGWSVGHQARLVAHDAYRPVFEQLAGGDGSEVEWRELEKRISRHSVTHRRAADVHGHSINMGILLILIGLFAPLVGNGGSRALFVLTAAAVIYPVGLFLQFLGVHRIAEMISATGAAGVVAALAFLYWRISRSVDALPR